MTQNSDTAEKLPAFKENDVTLKAPEKSDTINQGPEATGTDGSETILFVGGLDDKTTGDQLKLYFSKFGEVQEVNVIVDWVTGRSKRCALVFCSNTETATQILSCKKHMIHRRRVRVTKADVNKRGTKIIKAKILHLSQIHPSITFHELEQYLQQFGTVKKLRLTPLQSKDDIMQTRHGYLELAKEDDCQNILDNRRSLAINDFKFTCTPFRVRTAQESKLVQLIGKAPDSELLKYFEMYELTSQEADFEESIMEEKDLRDFDFFQMKYLLEQMQQAQQSQEFQANAQIYAQQTANQVYQGTSQYPGQGFWPSPNPLPMQPMVHPPFQPRFQQIQKPPTYYTPSYASQAFGSQNYPLPKQIAPQKPAQPPLIPPQYGQQPHGYFLPQQQRTYEPNPYSAPYYTHQNNNQVLQTNAQQRPEYGLQQGYHATQYTNDRHQNARAHQHPLPQAQPQQLMREGYYGPAFYPSHNQASEK